jgi:hypothetical protein
VLYRWLDIAGNPDVLKLLTERQLKPDQLLVLLFTDGISQTAPVRHSVFVGVHRYVQCPSPTLVSMSEFQPSLGAKRR